MTLDSSRFSVSRAVSVSSPPQKSPCYLNQQILYAVDGEDAPKMIRFEATAVAVRPLGDAGDLICLLEIRISRIFADIHC